MSVFQCVLHSNQCFNLFDRFELTADKEFRFQKKVIFCETCLSDDEYCFLIRIIYSLAMLVLLFNLLLDFCLHFNDAFAFL